MNRIGNIYTLDIKLFLIIKLLKNQENLIIDYILIYLKIRYIHKVKNNYFNNHTKRLFIIKLNFI